MWSSRDGTQVLSLTVNILRLINVYLWLYVQLSFRDNTKKSCWRNFSNRSPELNCHTDFICLPRLPLHPATTPPSPLPTLAVEKTVCNVCWTYWFHPNFVNGILENEHWGKNFKTNSQNNSLVDMSREDEGIFPPALLCEGSLLNKHWLSTVTFKEVC